MLKGTPPFVGLHHLRPKLTLDNCDILHIKYEADIRLQNLQLSRFQAFEMLFHKSYNLIHIYVIRRKYSIRSV